MVTSKHTFLPLPNPPCSSLAFFFFKIFFGHGPSLKSLLNLLEYCFYVLVSWQWDMWDSSSPTNNQTVTCCIGRQSLNPWNTRDAPRIILASLGSWLFHILFFFQLANQVTPDNKQKHPVGIRIRIVLTQSRPIWGESSPSSSPPGVSLFLHLLRPPCVSFKQIQQLSP